MKIAENLRQQNYPVLTVMISLLWAAWLFFTVAGQ